MIAAFATAVVATKVAHGFVQPMRVSSLRTGAASQHQQHRDTCSAIDNRRFRRDSVATTAALPASAGEDAGRERAELSCSGVEEQEEVVERPKSKRRWAAGARRSLARGAASLATFTFSATALSGLSADLQHRLNAGGDGATTVSMPGAMKSAEASVFKPFHKRTVQEKLANLPAFMVTNAKGSPYLSPTEANEPQVSDVRTLCSRSARSNRVVEARKKREERLVVVLSTNSCETHPHASVCDVKHVPLYYQQCCPRRERRTGASGGLLRAYPRRPRMLVQHEPRSRRDFVAVLCCAGQVFMQTKTAVHVLLVCAVESERTYRSVHQRHGPTMVNRVVGIEYDNQHDRRLWPVRKHINRQ